jgi:nicotinamide riboside kinase
VVCDTTALMTAVYSRLVFGDATLEDRAGELHRRHIGLTLLTALDLPWVADGFQRSGAQMRPAVDHELRALMRRQGIGFSVIGGSGGERLKQALAAAARLGAPTGLFTRLAGPPAANADARWWCECCPEPSTRDRVRTRS